MSFSFEISFTITSVSFLHHTFLLVIHYILDEAFLCISIPMDTIPALKKNTARLNLSLEHSFLAW